MFASEFKTDSESIIFDSGTSLLYYPKIYKDYLIDMLTFGKGVHVDRYGYHYVDCNSIDSLPSLYLMIEGYWIEVSPKTYVYSSSLDVQGDYCVIGLVENTDNTWLAGDAFMANFYWIFDDDNSEITLAPKRGG